MANNTMTNAARQEKFHETYFGVTNSPYPIWAHRALASANFGSTTLFLTAGPRKDQPTVSVMIAKEGCPRLNSVSKASNLDYKLFKSFFNDNRTKIEEIVSDLTYGTEGSDYEGDVWSKIKTDKHFHYFSLSWIGAQPTSTKCNRLLNAFFKAMRAMEPVLANELENSYIEYKG